MDHSLTPAMIWPDGLCVVRRLLPKAELAVDHEALARLYALSGPKRAAGVLAQTHQELAHRIEAVAIAHADCAFDALADAVRRIRRLSVDVGLPDLRRAADHVLDCIAQSDATALAATVGRLTRLGDVAVAQMGALRLPGF